MQKIKLSLKKALSLLGYLTIMLITSVLKLIAPPRARRLIYITTVYNQLVQENILKETTLAKLNQNMNLVCDESALKLPVEMSELIWHDICFKDIIKEELGQIVCNTNECLPFNDARAFSSRIVEQTPKWLMYGDRNKMVEDLEKLFYAHAMKV